MYQRGDIFLLIGQASSQIEIGDLKRDVEYLGPRYTIVITPEWVQDLDPTENFWSCQTLVDSATLGDVCAARWWIYGTNGISRDTFRVRMTADDIRVLHHAYQLVGIPCSHDPLGHVNVLGIPHSIGRSVVITTPDGERQMSRHSHVPFPSMTVFNGYQVNWPLAAPEQRPVSFGEKIVILGGHQSLGFEGSLNQGDVEPMMGSYYPRALARQALWAARCHYEARNNPQTQPRQAEKKGATPAPQPSSRRRCTRSMAKVDRWLFFQALNLRLVIVISADGTTGRHSWRANTGPRGYLESMTAGMTCSSISSFSSPM